MSGPALVAAVASNGVIGRDGELPWRLPDDLRHFKRLTMGHLLVMGRRTFESIGRPLPGRRTVVLTRQPGWGAPGVLTAPSLADALAQRHPDEVPFVIGGAAVYRAALPDAVTLHITHVHADVDGDVHFPVVDWDAWTATDETFHAADARHAHPFTIRRYGRR